MGKAGEGVLGRRGWYAAEESQSSAWLCRVLSFIKLLQPVHVTGALSWGTSSDKCAATVLLLSFRANFGESVL